VSGGHIVSDGSIRAPRGVHRAPYPNPETGAEKLGAGADKISASVWRGTEYETPAVEMSDPPLPSPREPIQNTSWHAREVDLARVLQPGYWRELCPSLHVCDEAFQASVRPMVGAALEEVADDARERILRDGYTKIPAACLPWKSVAHRELALACVQLIRHGWNPSFLLMYDEAWSIAHELSDVVLRATGNRLNFDALCWHVDPYDDLGDDEHTAFSPHRDRQPDDSPATFRPDGTAMYATAWVALTDATPENSCLYVIPRPRDPGYFEGDDDDPCNADADPLRLCLPHKEAYQHITAVPAEKGSAVLFTHRVIHWGSRGTPRSAGLGPRTPPRVCVSFGFADDAYEPAYVDRARNLPFPPLCNRAALVSAQMIAYHERFRSSARMLRLFHDAVTHPGVDGALEREYRKKVMYEYVQAAAAAGKKGTRGKGSSTRGGNNSLVGNGRKTREAEAEEGAEEDDDDDDDAEVEDDTDDDDADDDAMDRAMDAMLDAKMNEDGDDFHDDFDDLEDGVLEDEDGFSLLEPTPRLHAGKKKRRR